MSSRKEEKERLRREREEREREQATAAKRRRTLTYGGGALAAVAAVAVILALALSGGGSSKTVQGGSGATAGLQVGAAPWPPEYGSLATRLQALNLPTQSDVAYHIHAELRMYINGKQVPIPAQIGIDPQGQFLAALHTHDGSGVIHMEASSTYAFTLGHFFTIWGVKFTKTQLGGYVDGASGNLAVYVNGKRVADPPDYVMKPHDLIVVGFGKPGSFPTSYSYTFPNGE